MIVGICPTHTSPRCRASLTWTGWGVAPFWNASASSRPARRESSIICCSDLRAMATSYRCWDPTPVPDGQLSGRETRGRPVSLVREIAAGERGGILLRRAGRLPAVRRGEDSADRTSGGERSQTPTYGTP